MRLVFIDVDGTLLPAPNSETQFIVHLLKNGSLGLSQIGTAFLFLPRWWPHFGRNVAKKDKAYLAGLPESEVRVIAAAFVRRVLAPRLRAELLVRLDAHRRRGERLILLTGTPDFLAAPLAEAVGASRVCATRCAARTGRFLADPPESHPFQDEKRRLAEALCHELGCSLEHAVAYADSRHDLSLLERVGLPVAVAPDRTLERIALDRGWEILAGRRQKAPQLQFRSQRGKEG
jgi:HAD superfamily phosphoserine phosphatase-like hydrolase